ncbi:MAG: right-handed parallel beta-helix repeat-containing protein [Acidimicrobiales bacterium]|nr:right-handed parallel beta-helix repeat-containing protein [Acidimicrobiales bacterium]
MSSTCFAACALVASAVFPVGSAGAVEPHVADEIASYARPDMVVPSPPTPDFRIAVTSTVDGPSQDTDVTLRGAVDLASLLGGTVEIVLEPGADYRLGCGTGEDHNLDGDLDYTALGTLVLSGNGASISPASELCSPDRLLHAPNGGMVVVVDTHLSGGNGTGDGGAIRASRVAVFDSELVANSAAAGRGGAVFAEESLTIVGSTFTGNEARAYGSGRRGLGGAAMSAGTLVVFDSFFSANTAVYDGGALAVSGSPLAVVSGSTFEANDTYFGRGGALFAGAGADVAIVESVFRSNRASATTAGGGAVYVDGSLEVYDSTFEANEAVSLPVSPIIEIGGGGGAIYSEGVLAVVSTSFIENRSGRTGAGGAVSHKGSFVLIGSILRGNSAGGAGGAVFAGGGRSDNDHITIDTSVLTDNESRWAGGGALFLSSPGHISVSNSRISSNQAMHTGANGGGVLVNGSAVIERTTVDDNRAHHAGSGGGVHADVGSSVTLDNSTVSGNWAGSGGGVGAGTSPSGGVRLLHSTIAGNGALVGSNLSVGSLLQAAGSIVSDPIGPQSCAVGPRPLSLGGNIDGDGSCGFDGAGDVVVADTPVTADLAEVDGVAVREPVAVAALDNLRGLCATAGLDQLGNKRGDACDSGAVEMPGLLAVDDQIALRSGAAFTVNLLANDTVGNKPIVARFVDIQPANGVTMSGSPEALTLKVSRRAQPTVLGTYEICYPDGAGCSKATFALVDSTAVGLGIASLRVPSTGAAGLAR